MGCYDRGRRYAELKLGLAQPPFTGPALSPLGEPADEADKMFPKQP